MNDRLLSLDAFRGFTIAAMLLVNNPGDWGHLYGPLAHAHWNGWTFTDWIFPFFVFISGISMTISLGRRAALGDSKPALLMQTVRRGLVIIAIGLALNFIPAFDLGSLRMPGVLQRLGLCTMLDRATGVVLQLAPADRLARRPAGGLHADPVAGAGARCRRRCRTPARCSRAKTLAPGSTVC